MKNSRRFLKAVICGVLQGCLAAAYSPRSNPAGAPSSLPAAAASMPSFVEFTIPSKVVAGVSPVFATADFDSDGYCDIALIDSDHKSILILHGGVAPATRVTRAADPEITTEISAVQAGDFDGNGRMELCILSKETGGLNLFLQLAPLEFTFVPGPSMPAVQTIAAFGSVIFAGMRDRCEIRSVEMRAGAAVCDTIYTNYFREPVRAMAVALGVRRMLAFGLARGDILIFNITDGRALELQVDFRAYHSPSCMQFCDLDGRRVDDLLLGFELIHTVDIHKQSAGGDFSDAADDLPNHVRSLVTGDFNGDGACDLLLFHCTNDSDVPGQAPPQDRYFAPVRVLKATFLLSRQ